MKTKPSYKPTDEQRRQVEAMSGYGIPQDDICLVLEICGKTLRKYFRHELDVGSTKANAKVAESLYKKATGDGSSAVTAAIWWTKTRMGWKEGIDVNHGVSDGLADLMREIDGRSRGLPAAPHFAINGKANGANGKGH